MMSKRWFQFVALLLALPAAAQYKVIGPDGRVTYTDRPPVDAAARVTDLRRPGAAQAPVAATAGSLATLPAELQRLADRFPVTLFSSAECVPCNDGRTLLRQRGVPFSERLVANADDIAALERTVGGRTVPALTVGGQALRGFNAGDWTAYLDAAGYPRESRLPRGWTPPPAAPLVARAPVPPPTAAAPAPAPEAPPPAEPETPPESGTGIRF
jgi:glutaredoxin